MRIGIVTLPLHTNYGGILQAFALQTVLKRLGHDAKVINLNRKPTKLSFAKKMKFFVRRVLSSAKHMRVFETYSLSSLQQSNYAKFAIKTQNTQKFVDKYIDCFYVNSYRKDIKPSDFDAFVVGSDQIWSNYHGTAIDGSVVNAFLPFITKRGIIKLSYAASFGKDNWEYTKTETQLAQKAVKAFKAVSVREHSGINLCKQYLDVTAQQHLDPTMLLDMQDYIDAINIANVAPSPGNLLVYIIDSNTEKQQMVECVEKMLALTKFAVNSRAEDTNLKNIGIEQCIQPPVEQWLRGFYDAKFVITDSFHACVFSILFHKPFIAIGNAERGMARFQSLLEQFDLADRLIINLPQLQQFNLSAPINFAAIDAKLNAERERATTYLKQNLS